MFPKCSYYFHLHVSISPLSPGFLYELVVGPPLNLDPKWLSNAVRNSTRDFQIFPNGQTKLTGTNQTLNLKIG